MDIGFAKNIKFDTRPDGSVDVIINFNMEDAEFAADFLSGKNIGNYYKSISEYIKKTGNNVKLGVLKVVVGGMVIATVALSALGITSSADQRFSMSYIYGGTVSTQISYVERTNNSLNTVSPSYFDINADGSIKLNAPSQTLIQAMHDKSVKVVPFLSNHFVRSAGNNFLNNYDAAARQLAGYIEQYGLDGINVDIENVNEQYKDKYTAFVALLRSLVPQEKEVSVAVAANPNNWTTGWHGSYDYANLAKNSDYLMMMTYDEHWDGSEPGPVASIGWVENSIKAALKKAPADKLVLGLPFFGRLWSSDGNFVGSGMSLNFAHTLINDYNAEVTYSEQHQSPKAVFTVRAGDVSHKLAGKTLQPGVYTLWYENDSSIKAKLELVNKYNLKGAGSWALGNEQATLWKSYSGWLNGIDSPSGDSGAQTPATPAPSPTPQQPATPVPPAPSPEAQPPAPQTPKYADITAKASANATIYATPSTRGKVVAKISRNTQMTLISPYSSSFYSVKLANGTTGYIKAPLANLSLVTKKTTAKLSFRQAPSESSKRIRYLGKNTKVKVTDVVQNGYIKVFYGTTVGYVLAAYVR